MQIGKLNVENPLVLGPMAGVTDWAFRTVCAEMGADITVTEMVSSRALVYKDKKSAALLRKNDGCICGAQIFGNDPDIMAEGARRSNKTANNLKRRGRRRLPTTELRAFLHLSANVGGKFSFFGEKVKFSLF